MERQTRYAKGTAYWQEANNYSELSSLVQKMSRQQTFTQEPVRLIKEKNKFLVFYFPVALLLL